MLEIQGRNASWFQTADYTPATSLKVFSLNSDWNGGLVSESNNASETQFGGSFFTHSADTIPGASGSPILQNEKVVGMHVGALGKVNVGLDLSAIDRAEFNPSAGIVKENTVSTAIATFIGTLGLINDYVGMVDKIKEKEGKIRDQQIAEQKAQLREGEKYSQTRKYPNGEVVVTFQDPDMSSRRITLRGHKNKEGSL